MVNTGVRGLKGFPPRNARVKMTKLQYQVTSLQSALKSANENIETQLKLVQAMQKDVDDLRRQNFLRSDLAAALNSRAKQQLRELLELQKRHHTLTSTHRKLVWRRKQTRANLKYTIFRGSQKDAAHVRDKLKHFLSSKFSNPELAQVIILDWLIAKNTITEKSAHAQKIKQDARIQVISFYYFCSCQ
jgi:chromosome segregation ATPase